MEGSIFISVHSNDGVWHPSVLQPGVWTVLETCRVSAPASLHHPGSCPLLHSRIPHLASGTQGGEGGRRCIKVVKVEKKSYLIQCIFQFLHFQTYRKHTQRNANFESYKRKANAWLNND